MENQLARLTSARSTKNSAHFENLLMTTRRTPRISGYEAAATLRVVNPVGASSARTSFFTRRFSTISAQPNREALTTTKLVLGRSGIAVRSAVTGLQGVSDAQIVRSSASLKVRSIARARAQFDAELENDSATAADIRLLRVKSPRSSEYLLRAPTTVATPLRRQTSVRENARGHRNARGFIYKTAHEQKKLATRRAAAFKNLRICADTPRHQTRRVLIEQRRAERRNATKIFKNPRAQAALPRIATVRSPLHYRTAKTRSVKLAITTPPAIVSGSVFLRAATRFVLKQTRFRRRFARRVSRKRLAYKFRKVVLNHPRKKKVKKSRRVHHRLRQRVRLFRNNLLIKREGVTLLRRQGRLQNLGLSMFRRRLLTRKNKASLKLNLKSKFTTTAAKRRQIKKKRSTQLRAAEKRRSSIMFLRRRRKL